MNDQRRPNTRATTLGEEASGTSYSSQFPSPTKTKELETSAKALPSNSSLPSCDTKDEKNINTLHPTRLEDFYKMYPSFAWGPFLIASFFYGQYHIPILRHYLGSNGMQAFGWHDACQYTLFAIVGSYAFHGWCTTHAPQSLKLHQYPSSNNTLPFQVSAKAVAVRSTCTLCTELVYSLLPIAPPSTSWLHFFLWLTAVHLYWDAHFYFAHRWAHENKTLYRFLHKMHHAHKEPTCFGAYFVTYQSHVLLEQAVLWLMAMAGMPRDVFVFILYWGTVLTFVEHSGYELTSLKLPFAPFLTFGHLCTLLGLPTAFLEGVHAAEHEWHHEQFLNNYSLFFSYLDKFFGTYHPGRVPGGPQQVAKAKRAA